MYKLTSEPALSLEVAFATFFEVYMILFSEMQLLPSLSKGWFVMKSNLWLIKDHNKGKYLND